MALIILFIDKNDHSVPTLYEYDTIDGLVEGICDMYECEFIDNNPTYEALVYEMEVLFNFVDNLREILVLKLNETTNLYWTHGRDWIKTQIEAYMLRKAGYNVIVDDAATPTE
ncbi:enhancer of rudimentary homolog [Teleopsis dalmanni]|uniref:enhancer of rudimentary homolog n=1 Tax=Teleopsis dalmanni TaxID=139649 RepID=UPI0018CEA837|nr:enhancer of rudimentary homolog [Teleopsis dalmanni]